MLKRLQFPLFKFSSKCENVVSFRGAKPPWPGALPPNPTEAYTLGTPYRLVLPHSPSPHQKIINPPLPLTEASLNSWSQTNSYSYGELTLSCRGLYWNWNIKYKEFAIFYEQRCIWPLQCMINFVVFWIKYWLWMQILKGWPRLYIGV